MRSSKEYPANSSVILVPTSCSCMGRWLRSMVGESKVQATQASCRIWSTINPGRIQSINLAFRAYIASLRYPVILAPATPMASQNQDSGPTLYSTREEWKDVKPIEQSDLQNPLVPIFYPPECERLHPYLNCQAFLQSTLMVLFGY